jgi:hypothetical protein
VIVDAIAYDCEGPGRLKSDQRRILQSALFDDGTSCKQLSNRSVSVMVEETLGVGAPSGFGRLGSARPPALATHGCACSCRPMSLHLGTVF